MNDNLKYMIKGFCPNCGNPITEDDWVGCEGLFYCNNCCVLLDAFEEDYEEERE